MELSALATAAAVRSRERTAAQVCEETIARIEQRDGPLNAVVVRDFERALASAHDLDADINAGFDGPLLGVAMTVKESYDVAGLPTTWGFEAHRDFRPARDADLVTRLKRAGAIILGKTNVPPALADLQSTNPVYGRTNNPHDHARVCGGSSGGSAAALASGMVPLEIGSDIGGSIRVPAHFCGVWGLKPTYGVLSREGHVYPGTDGHPGPLSVAGPLARDADDLAAALDVLSNIPLPRPRVAALAGLRILVVDRHPVAPVDPAIAAVLDRLATSLAGTDARVSRDASALPDQTEQYANYMRLLLTTLARGQPSDDGVQASLADWFVMLDEQARCIRQWQTLFDRFDAVIAPVLGTTAFPHSDIGTRDRTLTIGGVESPFGLQFAFPGMATYPNLPACAVPVGRADGLPIGVQVITAHHRDHDAIAIAGLVHEVMR